MASAAEPEHPWTSYGPPCPGCHRLMQRYSRGRASLALLWTSLTMCSPPKESSGFSDDWTSDALEEFPDSVLEAIKAQADQLYRLLDTALKFSASDDSQQRPGTKSSIKLGPNIGMFSRPCRHTFHSPSLEQSTSTDLKAKGGPRFSQSMIGSARLSLTSKRSSSRSRRHWMMSEPLRRSKASANRRGILQRELIEHGLQATTWCWGVDAHLSWPCKNLLCFLVVFSPLTRTRSHPRHMTPFN